MLMTYCLLDLLACYKNDMPFIISILITLSITIHLHCTVKLYNQGLEAIEVSDNGSGVPLSSRPLMAMKHATSKLRQFDDLYQNNQNAPSGNDNNNTNIDGGSYAACAPTLCFPGETLFCLANLSRSLVVSTRTSNDNTFFLTFNSLSL